MSSLFCISAYAKPTIQAQRAEALHVLNRLGYGPRPGDLDHVLQVGVDRYIEEQLHPETIAMPKKLDQHLAELSQDKMSQSQLITTYRQVIKAAMEDGPGGAPDGGIARRNALYKQMAVHFGELRLAQAIESPRHTTIVVLSEFGRTVAQNGNGGTDHGHGNAMWLLGGNVAGGKVHGDWTGLEDGQLHEGRDLPVTTDYRTVLAQVCERHLKLPDSRLSDVFPSMPKLDNRISLVNG